MNEKIVKTITGIAAPFIIISEIVHYSGKDLHYHPEAYNITQSYIKDFAVVSGTTTNPNFTDNIEDIGPNPDKEGEHLFRITLPSSYY